MKPSLVRRLPRLCRLRAESAAELALCKLLTLCLPFRGWSRACGILHCETLRENMRLQQGRIRAIGHSLRWTAAVLPWRSKCLDQAMAAQRMLARRGLQSTIYYGMARDEGKKWLAHAW